MSVAFASSTHQTLQRMVFGDRPLPEPDELPDTLKKLIKSKDEDPTTRAIKITLQCLRLSVGLDALGELQLREETGRVARNELPAFLGQLYLRVEQRRAQY